MKKNTVFIITSFSLLAFCAFWVVGNLEDSSAADTDSKSEDKVIQPKNGVTATGDKNTSLRDLVGNREDLVKRLSLQPDFFPRLTLARSIAKYDREVESGYLESFLDLLHGDGEDLEKMDLTVEILRNVDDPLRRIDLATQHLSGGPLSEALVDTVSWYRENDLQAALYDFKHFPPGPYRGQLLTAAFQTEITDLQEVGFRLGVLAEVDPVVAEPAKFALGESIARAYNAGKLNDKSLAKIRSGWDPLVERAFSFEIHQDKN